MIYKNIKIYSYNPISHRFSWMGKFGLTQFYLIYPLRSSNNLTILIPCSYIYQIIHHLLLTLPNFLTLSPRSSLLTIRGCTYAVIYHCSSYNI